MYGVHLSSPLFVLPPHHLLYRSVHQQESEVLLKVFEFFLGTFV